MSGVTYEKFLTYIVPFAKNVAEPQAIVAIRNACIAFCTETMLLQEELDPISTVAGEPTYDIGVSAQYQPIHVMQLSYQSRLLDKRAPFEIEKMYSRNWRVVLGTPRIWWQPRPDEITVVPVPDRAEQGAITGVVAVTPTRESLTVDEMLFSRYAENIADGALSRLLLTPHEPYTDVAASQFYATRFRSACANVRAYVTSGSNRAPMRVRFNKV